MNQQQVMALLKKSAASQKAIRSGSSGKLKSFGVGLTDLRKLARQIGRDHDLALELWQSDVYEARILGLLIDDPKHITREQAEQQVQCLVEPVFAHVFSACNATLAKTPFAVELATDWIASDDPVRRRCGYGLLSDIASARKKSDPDEAFFLGHLKQIHRRWQESGVVEGAYAVLCIGKRSPALNAAALRLAQEVGPVHYDDDDDCEPFDLVRHLTTDHLKKRLGIR